MNGSKSLFSKKSSDSEYNQILDNKLYPDNNNDLFFNAENSYNFNQRDSIIRMSLNHNSVEAHSIENFIDPDFIQVVKNSNSIIQNTLKENIDVLVAHSTRLNETNLQAIKDMKTNFESIENQLTKLANENNIVYRDALNLLKTEVINGSLSNSNWTILTLFGVTLSASALSLFLYFSTKNKIDQLDNKICQVVNSVNSNNEIIIANQRALDSKLKDLEHSNYNNKSLIVLNSLVLGSYTLMRIFFK